MKKFTTIAILTAMLASLAACGGESAGSAGGDTPAVDTPPPKQLPDSWRMICRTISTLAVKP